LTFKAKVRCNVSKGEFNNTANATGKTGDNEIISAQTYMNMTGYKAKATITKSVDDPNPTWHQTLEYTIVIRNILNTTSSNYTGANVVPRTVKDVFPPYLRYINASAHIGSGGEIPLGGMEIISGAYQTGMNVTWNFTDDVIPLSAGEFMVITYKAQVMPGINKTAARNDVILTYLDPQVHSLCPDCIFNATQSEIIAVVGEPANFTLQLNSGWNLISIPVRPINKLVDAVFEQYGKIFTYNDGWDYAAYADGERFGNLDEVEVGRGYWIYVDEAKEINIEGKEVEVNISLGRGWNLVGWPYPDEDLPGALSSIDDEWTHVFTYENDWLYRVRSDGEEFGDLEAMEQGMGYWIKVKDSCMLYKKP